MLCFPVVGLVSRYSFLIAVAVKLLSHVQNCDPMNCSRAGFHVLCHLPELVQTHVHWVGDTIQQSRPLSSLLLLFSTFPSLRVLSNTSALLIRWPKYWSFSFIISSFHEYSGLISFRIDCLDFLAVQGTLKSLLQHYSSKTSILQHSAFFMVQLSHPYMTTGKTITLTRWTFVDDVLSLLFNMLSRFVKAFLPSSNYLLISWPQSPFAVILETKKINSVNCFRCFPINIPWGDGTGCHDLSFLNVVF